MMKVLKLRSKLLVITALMITALTSCAKEEQLVKEEQLTDDTSLVGKSPDIKPNGNAVFEFNQIISAESEKERLQHKRKYSDFETTGLYANGDDVLNIRVIGLNGTTVFPKLLIGTYGHVSNPQEVQLIDGVNLINVDEPGLVYVRYTSDNPNPNNSVRLKFRNNGGFDLAAHFIKGETSEAEWATMVNSTDAPHYLLEGDRVLMMFDNAAVATGGLNLSQTDIVQYYDDIMFYQSEITGLTNATKPAHKMLMAVNHQMSAPGSAAHYRVNINSNNDDSYFNLDLNKDQVNWLAVHELGHQHQQNWTWSSIGESTNNIFAMHANNQLGFGYDSYLDPSGTFGNKAQQHWDAREAYFNLDLNDRDILVFDTPGVNREKRRRNLVMFYQLWVSFGDDFYKDVHDLARGSNFNVPNSASEQEKIEFFYEAAFLASEKNLSTFFREWGLERHVSQTVIDRCENYNFQNAAGVLQITGHVNGF